MGGRRSKRAGRRRCCKSRPPPTLGPGRGSRRWTTRRRAIASGCRSSALAASVPGRQAPERLNACSWAGGSGPRMRVCPPVRESRRHEQPVLATVMERGEEGRSAIRRLPLTADRPDAGEGNRPVEQRWSGPHSYCYPRITGGRASEAMQGSPCGLWFRSLVTSPMLRTEDGPEQDPGDHDTEAYKKTVRKRRHPDFFAATVHLQRKVTEEGLRWSCAPLDVPTIDRGERWDEGGCGAG